VYEAILCVADLVRRGHPFTLDVVGRLDSEGAERYPWAVRELIEKLDLGDKITLHGHSDDPSRFYRNMDVFLSNSYWEGQQVALLEAMASGCFCLSHFWSGAEEVLPPENIFDTGTDLRAKLVAYAAQPDSEKTAAQVQMRAIAEQRFDHNRMVRDVLQIIEEAWASS
jgi:glycosyltransferase involved in cell wall biosynthesis